MAQWSMSVDSSLLMHFSFSFSGHQALSLFFTNYFKNNLSQTCHTLSYSFSSNQFTPMALLPLRVTYTLLLHKIGILGFRIFSNCYKGYQIVSKINSESFIMVSNIFKFNFATIHHHFNELSLYWRLNESVNNSDIKQSQEENYMANFHSSKTRNPLLYWPSSEPCFHFSVGTLITFLSIKNPKYTPPSWTIE